MPVGLQQDLPALSQRTSCCCCRDWGTGLRDIVLASHSHMALSPTTMVSGGGGPPSTSSSGCAPYPARCGARHSPGRALRPQAHVGLPHVAAGLGLRPVIKPSGLTDTDDFGNPVQSEHTGSWRSYCWGSVGNGALGGLGALLHKAQALSQVRCSGLWSYTLCS